MSWQEWLAKCRRVAGTHPYLLLTRGGAREPCPVHRGVRALMLPVEHPYWPEHAVRKGECGCVVRLVRSGEVERLRQEGLPYSPRGGVPIREEPPSEA